VKLEYAFLAGDATVGEQGLFVFGGNQTRVLTPGIPFLFPKLAVVATFVFDSPADQIGHELSLQLRRPNGEPLWPRQRLPVEFPPASPLPGEPLLGQFCAGIGPIPLEVEGTWVFEIWLDDHLAKALPLVVMTAERATAEVAAAAERETDG
jgi:hypothetical protein